LVHESLHVDLVCKLLRISLAYQPPASSTFISEQTSNQSAVLFSQNKSAPANQPPAQQTGFPQNHCIQFTRLLSSKR
jgi:hypothetical protein